MYFFEYIDVFGKEVIFKINKASKYQSKLGGMFTVVLGIISIVSVYLFGNDIIYKLNPKFLIRRTYLDDFPYHVLNSTNMFLAIQLSDYYGGTLNDSILTSKFFYNLMEYDNKTSHLKITEEVEGYLQKCNDSHIEKSIVQEEGLENYMCLSFNNYTVGGSWFSKKLGIVGIRNYVCSEQTEKDLGIKCKSREEIGQMYNQSFYLNIKYWNGIVDPSNFVAPIKKILEFNYIVLGIDDYKENMIYYTPAVVKTDTGIIGTEVQTQDFLMLEKTMVDVSQSIKGKICETIIYITKINQEFSRSYLKLQEIAATVGGLFSIMFYFLSFVYYFYITNNIDYYLIEKFFTLQVDSPGNQLTKERSVNPVISESEVNGLRIVTYNRRNISNYFDNQRNSTNTISEVKQYRPSNTHEVNSRENSRRLSTIVEYNKKPRIKLNVKEGEMWVFKFCKCPKDSAYHSSKMSNQVIFLAQTELYKRMDINTYLHVYEQFQTLKKINFNSSQCFMLENIDRKLITNVEVAKDTDYTQTIEAKLQQKIEELDKYLDNNLLEDVDHYLFQILDEKIKGKLMKFKTSFKLN